MPVAFLLRTARVPRYRNVDVGRGRCARRVSRKQAQQRNHKLPLSAKDRERRVMHVAQKCRFETALKAVVKAPSGVQSDVAAGGEPARARGSSSPGWRAACCSRLNRELSGGGSGTYVRNFRGSRTRI